MTGSRTQRFAVYAAQCAGVLMLGVRWAGAADFPFCQYVDGDEMPAWSVGAGWTSSSSVETPGGGAYSEGLVEGGGGLLFLGEPGHEGSLHGAYVIRRLDGEQGLVLPDYLADLHLDLAYTWRTWDGRSLRLRALPGWYAELDASGSEGLLVPFEVLGLQVLSPRLSAQLGVAVFPGFQRSFDPRFGLRYALSDQWRADLGYPCTQVQYARADGLAWVAGVCNRPAQEYVLADDDPREALRLEESAWFTGCDVPAGPVRLGVRIEGVFSRSLDYREGSAPVAVEDAMRYMVSVGGAL